MKASSAPQLSTTASQPKDFSPTLQSWPTTSRHKMHSGSPPTMRALHSRHPVVGNVKMFSARKLSGRTWTRERASPTPTPARLMQPCVASAMQHIYLCRSASARVQVYIRIGRWSKLLILRAGNPVPKGYLSYVSSTGCTSTLLGLVIWRRYFVPPGHSIASTATMRLLR